MGDAKPLAPQEIRTVTLFTKNVLTGEQFLEVRLDETPAIVTWRAGELERKGALEKAEADALRGELYVSSFWSLPSVVGGDAYDGGETRMIVDTARGSSTTRVRSWTGDGEQPTYQAARRLVDLVERHAAAALQ